MSGRTYKWGSAVLLALSLLMAAGCETEARQSTPAEAQTQDTEPRSAQLFAAEPASITYPIDDSGEALTVFMPQETLQTGGAPVLQMVQERTGIPVTYQLIPGDGYQWSLLACLWGESFPDLIWGVDETMLENQTDPDTYAPLLVLNEYIQKAAPNYVRIVAADEEKMHQAVDDKGNILRFLTFYDTPDQMIEYGPVIRQDLLERYQLSLPETYEDWENALKQMQGDVDTPLLVTPAEIYNWDYLSAGMGISLAFDGDNQGFYQVDGQVKYGPLEENFTQFMTLMNHWYQENLLSNRFLDFNNTGSSEYLLKQANGESAIFFLSNSQLASVTVLSEIEGFDIALLQDPVLSRGEVSHIAPEREKTVYGAGFSISADCDNPELAVRFVDFLYSEEGIRLTNYGQQDVTYQMEQGKPVYTDAVTKQPDLLNGYTSTSLSGVISQARIQRQLEEAFLCASNAWNANKDSLYMLPESLEMTPEVEEELRGVMFDLATCAQTAAIELMVGERPLSDIPAVQQELMDIGAERCMELLQESLDAYLLR